MNASYQASLVNRHIRRFTGCITLLQCVYVKGTNRDGISGECH